MRQKCSIIFMIAVGVAFPPLSEANSSDLDLLMTAGTKAFNMGQMQRAEQCFAKAFSMAKKNPKQQALFIQSSVGLSNTYLAMEAPDKAQECCLEYLSQAKKSDPRQAQINLLNNLAIAYVLQHRPSDAEPILLRALDLHKADQLAPSPSFITTTRKLGRVYADLHKLKQSAEAYGLLVEVREKAAPLDSCELAKDLNSLAFVTMYLNKFSDAELLFKKSRALLEEQNDCQLELATTLEGYAELLNRANRAEEGAKLTERAKLIRSRKVPDSPV